MLSDADDDDVWVLVESSRVWTLVVGAELAVQSQQRRWDDGTRYDTRCYFNVRSKADISQLNLPHGTDN